MAASTCVRCGGMNFEIALANPQGGRYKVYFIQCASCGGVVGVQDFFNLPTLLVAQNKVINQIAAKLGVMSDLAETC